METADAAFRCKQCLHCYRMHVGIISCFLCVVKLNFWEYRDVRCKTPEYRAPEKVAAGDVKRCTDDCAAAGIRCPKRTGGVNGARHRAGCVSQKNTKKLLYRNTDARNTFVSAREHHKKKECKKSTYMGGRQNARVSVVGKTKIAFGRNAQESVRKTGTSAQSTCENYAMPIT